VWKPGSSAFPAGAATASPVQRPKTTVEWPSEKKKPTPTERLPRARNVRVVLSIAAMWSASNAWRRPNVYARTPRPASAGFPDAYHAKRPQPSTWRSATTPAKPDSRSHMSVHFPDGVTRHDGARDEDHRCRDSRKRADEQAVEAPLRERLLREHSDQADAGDREREPDRERDDQNEPEGQPVQRDRREQDDERGWARQQP